jgi:hypothetical protein
MRLHLHDVPLFCLTLSLALIVVAGKSTNITVGVPSPLVVPPSQYCKGYFQSVADHLIHMAGRGWNRWFME